MVDVTVRGAGIFGLSVAWSCARRGARVRVIDPGGPGAGASGGLVGALAPHVPEQWNAKKEFQLDSLLMAEGYWAEVRALAGRDPGYARLGRLQPIADDGALTLARARGEGARALWGDRAVWEVVEASGRDWAPQSPTGLLIRDTLSARLRPRRACASLAAAILARGGEVVTEGSDEGRVVWATGVQGLRDMGAEDGRPVGGGVKGQAALLAHDADDFPQIFALGVHVVPHADGTVAVGSTSERDFDDPHGTDAQLDAVIAAARAAVPALGDAPVVQRWAGVRPRSRTRAPMLGAHPLRPGQFIANGGFKIGFGMAPRAGEVMADLLLDGAAEIPAAFDPAASF